MTPTRATAPPCRACGLATRPLDLAGLPLVFSDCRPWTGPQADPRSCTCGLVQKPLDPGYLRAVADGYAGYAPYEQAGGSEQAVASGSGALTSRSTVLARALTERGLLPESGVALDYGCGNGAFLVALRQSTPALRLDGADIGSHLADAVRGIDGVSRYVELPFADGDASAYDLVSLIHVLEHVEDPAQTLADLGSRLLPGGRIVIQVPTYALNPFDLCIADHLSHFTPGCLADLAGRSGLRIALGPSQIVPRELTMVLCATSTALPQADAHPVVPQSFDTDSASRYLLDWKELVARVAVEDEPVVVFGSSISASWVISLLDSMGRTASVLLDEDTNRSGGRFRGVPIAAPREAQVGSPRVLVPLAPALAAGVADRLASLGMRPCFVG